MVIAGGHRRAVCLGDGWGCVATGSPGMASWRIGAGIP